MATIGIDIRLWKETGIGRYIRNLVEELVNIQTPHTFVLFALPQDIEEVKVAVLAGKQKQNFTIISADVQWHSVKEQVEFPRILNKYNLDLMHFPYFSIPAFYKKPFVVTVHDLIINHFPTGRATTLPLPIYLAKRIGYSFILKNAITKSRKIIVPSEATKDEILSHYKISSKKVIVTQEGIDDAILDFKPTIFKEKHPYFLYVGNAYPHKNVEKLIEAFLLFSEKYPEYKLRLVGKKDFFYQRLVKKIVNPNIEFMGYVSDADLAKLYKYAEATFVPSLMEGFGLTALEAMRMGSVVACSQIPSLEEVCGKNAFYFNPQDVISIFSTMEEVKSLTNERRDERIQKGKKHAQTFSWEKMAKETIDVYNSCL